MSALIIGTYSLLSFMPSVKPTVNSFKYYGDIEPLGYFDPLKLSTEKNSKYLRETELHHGRVAMLSATFLPLYEILNPGKLSINFLSDMDFNSQLPFWYCLALLEVGRLLTAYENPFVNGSGFTIKKKFQPGNYLNLDEEEISNRRYNTELSNGRLAMLASAHIIGSELLTHKSLF
jgi:hypothetical protein